MAPDNQSTLALPDLPGISKGWELVELDEPAKRGSFTAEQLEQNTAKRDAVLSALAEGLAIRQVARAFRISTNTVLALSRRSVAQIDTLKEGLGRAYFDLSRLAVERMIDEIDEMPRASLPIVAGVSTDKGQLLSGGPTGRVQHDHTLGIASMTEYIESLPSAVPVDPLSADPQKALEVAAVLVPIVAGVESGRERAGDSQSPVPATSSEVAATVGPELGQITAKKEGA